ncbi:conserved hypothetical protein [Ricinus communis]|uniref:TF-B3 domain-containing protein n=1 Tax=Ricinus communis TaxID=3988 RepID=B9R7J8_RICCO|nr:conserved hypothetical protein [Ricinus communis]
MAKEENEEELINARRPCFFEIFSSNLSSDRLRIPARFTRHLEGRTSGSVSLTGPSGNIWTVNLIQQSEDIFFDHGWPVFVKDHFIACGDLLLFRFDGELCFTVQVFDQSKCEKEAAFHSKCTQNPIQFYISIGQKRERDDGDDDGNKDSFLVRSCESMPKKVKRGQEESSLHETKQCWSPCQNTAASSRLNICHEILDPKAEVAIQKRTGKEDRNLADRGYGSIFLEREKRVAQSFISCFPYFVRIMKRFNISGSYTLNIPYQFSTAHLPSSKTEIVLRTIKGACWTVNSVPTTRVHTSHTFCGGWMAFVRSNDIKIGDVCIFELVRKYELRVFILRVGKEVVEDQSGNVAPDGGSIDSMSTSHKIENFPKQSRKSGLKVHSRLITKVEVCDRKKSNKSQAAAFCNRITKHGDAAKGSGTEKQAEAIACSRKNLDVELSPHAAAGLRMMAEAAKSFTSGFPNFVRIMRKFNISGSYTLKIPHQFSAAHLPNYKTEIILRNSHGERWTVNSVPDSKGRTVHTFCGGWMAFVRDNDVKEGDICMFELVTECEMLVHISGVGGKMLHSPS